MTDRPPGRRLPWVCRRRRRTGLDTWCARMPGPARFCRRSGASWWTCLRPTVCGPPGGCRRRPVILEAAIRAEARAGLPRRRFAWEEAKVPVPGHPVPTWRAWGGLARAPQPGRATSGPMRRPGPPRRRRAVPRGGPRRSPAASATDLDPGRGPGAEGAGLRPAGAGPHGRRRRAARAHRADAGDVAGGIAAGTSAGFRGLRQPARGRLPAAARARVAGMGRVRPPADLLDPPGPPVSADRLGNPPVRPVIATDLDMFRPGRGLPGRSWRPWRCGLDAGGALAPPRLRAAPAALNRPAADRPAGLGAPGAGPPRYRGQVLGGPHEPAIRRP
jgi:hypothetical protein